MQNSLSITMASASNSSSKKLIQIDVSADTVCPWCFVGKKNLDKAIASSNDKYTFEIKWHPHILTPSAPKGGVVKDFYLNKFGPRVVQMEARMTEIFKGLGMDYDTSGLTRNTLDSHMLIYFAGQQGPGKQQKLVEELGLGYFTPGKYIGDRKFLVEAGERVGVEGAAEFLENPNNGLKEVNGGTQEVFFQYQWSPSLCGKREIPVEWRPTTRELPTGFPNCFEQLNTSFSLINDGVSSISRFNFLSSSMPINNAGLMSSQSSLLRFVIGLE